jgi:hypothetical protein
MEMEEPMLQDLFNRYCAVMLGRSLVKSFVLTRGNLSLQKYRRYRKQLKVLRREFYRCPLFMEEIHRACSRDLPSLSIPIALISQIQRSGGSLLSQLFDGHPQLHAHPHELKIGFPKKDIWPQFDMSDPPQRWFEMLFEEDVIRHFKHGYEKGQKDGRTFAFIFLPALQRLIFLDYLNGREAVSSRVIFDAYMTSYFGAWLNNQNSGGEKKYITAFTPRLGTRQESIRSFFSVYPDGRLISIIRDPMNWYPSARRHETAKNKYADIRQSLAQWNENALAMVRNKGEFGERALIIRFEDLVGQTEAVMRGMADYLQIEYHPILLEPTFNKIPIKANTSFQQEDGRILAGALKRHERLTVEERDIIAATTTGIYAQVVAASACF